MKKLLLACAALLTISVVVSVNLWRELHAERQENANLQTQLTNSRITRPSILPALAAAAPAASTTSAAPAAQTPATESQQARAEALRARTAATSATISALASSLGVSSEQDLMKDPEYRKARLAQLRIQIARSYPGLVEELGLSQKEANQLFDLMAENQLKMSTELTARNATGGPTDIAEMVKRQVGTQKEQEDAIRAILGPGRYEQYQAYQQTRPARQQVVTMGSQLAAAGVPLSDSQSRALTSVMIAEQQQQRQQPPPPIGQSIDPAATAQSRTAQLLEESQRRQEENNRRVLDAVAPQLSAKQLATLKDQFEQQNAARRDTLSRIQGLQLIPPVPAQRP